MMPHSSSDAIVGIFIGEADSEEKAKACMSAMQARLESDGISFYRLGIKMFPIDQDLGLLVGGYETGITIS
jgi:hypothetical protein